ncbi:hypothetical protein S7S_06260 [Isoalcanivorax pacificus W11-5]|uniref:Methyltransferase type 11 domain-containing protein n=1 Tax=Isoalcanivorax pacificus W11-5 TaxID=391936 RepID=A0A0B4XM86_9GAMM|nr:methyltransferase domain-containing protein [Isoalcanivorax pacificus]AJD47668.1 hypothetical protein S7S_06260 [Isoalcanivorax pacificus W11-5]
MGWYEDHIFPPLLDWATRPLERTRRELLAQASGRVLELGVGTGANFPSYTAAATEIHGIEPTPALLRLARDRAASLPDPQRFTLVKAGAEALPYPDDHFDSVVACLVFCTIPDTEAAAAEIARVLRPGGTVLVLEHVASHRHGLRRLQRGINPVWRRLACGCELTRDTAALLHRHGFDLNDTRHWRHPALPGLMAEVLYGRATLPG